MKTNVRSVKILGHSLGGALASLCTVWFAQKWGSIFHGPLEMWTIGAPRPGNAAFHDLFVEAVMLREKTRCFRLVNDRDLIPCTPTTALQFLEGVNYHHVGELVYLRHNGDARAWHEELEEVGAL